MEMKPRSDFADWLSPILVKELRQGMSARAFITSFLLLQGLMLLVVITGLLISAHHEDISGTNAFFWMMVGVPVLLIMPFAGLVTVSREIKANTLELIFLTHLSARRIIVGKWLALVSQITLLVCAVLPYVVLRYFLGGVNVGTELLTLGWMLLGSALLTGVAVGISPYQSRVARVFLTLGVVFGVQGIFGIVSVFAMSGRTGFHSFIFTSSGVGPDLKWLIALLVIIALLLLLMLEIGASKIAPPAENHAWIKRTIGFAFALLPLVFTHDTDERGGFTFFTLILLAPICAGALCERIQTIPSLYRPFARRGIVGKMVGRIMYPGWPSGFVFTLIIFAIPFLLLWQDHVIVLPWQDVTSFRPSAPDASKMMAILVSLYAAVLMPAWLTRVFFPKARNPLAFHFAAQILGVVFVVIAEVVDSSTHGNLKTMACLFPTSALILTITDAANIESSFVFAASAIWLAVSVLVLAVKSIRPWREIRALEALALAQKTSAPNDVTSAATSESAA